MYIQELIERLNSLFGEATPLKDQMAFVNQIAAITRENPVVMAQINKNSKDQAMKGNLPGAVHQPWFEQCPRIVHLRHCCWAKTGKPCRSSLG